ncbi:hypothetical protein CNMCM6106_007710 [Aspergillus hiratsukae]|uniref:Uncharacterized protein n=1 Tax=Aspergillus hiratsukae TaxID=1194566 RepID=A0A8H6V381_9EURO|nr:hypothetical protein CNMCM6106_007710 [Aspergillus hiratsukae]
MPDLNQSILAPAQHGCRRQTEVRTLWSVSSTTNLRDTFGLGTSDIFQMEFPARLLDMGDLYYDKSGAINAQQIKPPAVAEAEFRLADDMFSLSNLVGGPNGSKLTDSYREVLFGLVPSNKETSDELAKLNLPRKPQAVKDKLPTSVARLRDPEKSPKIPRVDLYQKLLDIYDSERFRWVTFKNDARPDDTADQAKFNTYDHHRVRKYVAYIDVETASESLQRAKEDLRASVSRSIDDTENIYPVVFSPSNWAKYLTTNFTPEDLLSSEDIVPNRLLQAEEEKAILVLQRDAFQAGAQDIKALEKAESDARITLSNSEAAMLQGFSSNVIDCVKRYFDVTTRQSQNKLDALKALTDANKEELNQALEKRALPPLKPDEFEKLKNMQAQCIQNQQTFQNAAENYSRAQLAVSQARGNDPTTSIEVLTEKITSLTMDIEYYNKSLQGSQNPFGVPMTVFGTDGKAKTTKDGASIWQWITIDTDKSKDNTTKLSSSHVSHSDWSVSFFFGRGSGHSDSSTTDSSHNINNQHYNVQIGFRAMKVSIDRPWMNAQLLGQTREFFRLHADKITDRKPTDLHDDIFNGVVDSSNLLLPSWSTGFIVVKDVHIILKAHEQVDVAAVHDMQSSTSSGGGFLCFRVSKSESSSDHRASASVTSDTKYISIKIPAPQIIGCICQLAPTDDSTTTYTPFTADKEFPGFVKPPPAPPSKLAETDADESKSAA